MVFKKKKKKTKVNKELDYQVLLWSFCNQINTVVNKKNSKWSNPINSSQQHVVVNKTSVCERERERERQRKRKRN